MTDRELVTLTVCRRTPDEDVDITCAIDIDKLCANTVGWLVESVDEEGFDVVLTETEIVEVAERARAGEDETGQ